MEKRGQFPHEVFQKAYELGFIGMNIPEKYEGRGLGNLKNALVFEAPCRQDSSVGLALAYVRQREQFGRKIASL